jgi:DNA recombination protein RmuC
MTQRAGSECGCAELVPQSLLLGALVLVIVLLVVLVVRRPPGQADAALLQQQFIELRSRFDALITVQQQVPRALAEGSAAQTQVLSDVRERLGQLGEVTKRLETVGGAVTEVQQLLQVPKLRGTIGELWLEELLRQILPASSYEMQHTFKSGDRVDAVVRVGDRMVPVDAKFPLEACQRMLAATGAEAERERRAFVRSLKARVDEIADKYIRPDEGTYEFALMYIPAENVYYESLLRAQDPEDGNSIFSHAMARKVVPVSPHTFYAYLLVILHGLKGMKFELRAREIQDQLGALRQQFEAFWVAFEKAGAHLGNAVKQFEESDRQAGKVHDRFEKIAGAGLDAEGEAGTE